MLEALTSFYKKYGVGDFGLNRAFRISTGEEKISFVPISDIDDIKLSDLDEENIIMPAYGMDMDVQNLLKGRNPRCQFTTLESYSAFSMVEQGIGIVLTNELMTRGRVNKMKVLPLDPPQSIRLGVAFPSDTQLTPAAAKFIDYAKMVICDSSAF